TDKVGFQVTHISAASPAERCGLRVQEDFVVGLNGKKIAEMEADSIMGVIKAELAAEAVAGAGEIRICLAEAAQKAVVVAVVGVVGVVVTATAPHF
ncbi:hypothetical protein B484DRAFT_389732, partial [Ochromonadaceae sp. CCMP2298]